MSRRRQWRRRRRRRRRGILHSRHLRGSRSRVIRGLHFEISSPVTSSIWSFSLVSFFVFLQRFLSCCLSCPRPTAQDKWGRIKFGFRTRRRKKQPPKKKKSPREEESIRSMCGAVQFIYLFLSFFFVFWDAEDKPWHRAKITQLPFLIWADLCISKLSITIVNWIRRFSSFSIRSIIYSYQFRLYCLFVSVLFSLVDTSNWMSLNNR